MMMMLMMVGSFKTFFSKCGLFSELKFTVQEHYVLINWTLAGIKKKSSPSTKFAKPSVLLNVTTRKLF